MKYKIGILSLIFVCLLPMDLFGKSLMFAIPSIPTYEDIPIYAEYLSFIRDSLNDVDIQVEFKPIPTMRQFDVVRKGQMDALILDNPHLREESPDVVSTSFPLLLLRFKIIHRKNDGSFGKKDLKDFQGATVLSWYLLKTEVERKGLKYVETPSVQQNIKMLLANRVDYVLASEGIAKGAIELITSAKEELKIEDRSFVEIPIYFSINRKHIKLLPQIEKNLKRHLVENASRYHLLKDSFYPIHSKTKPQIKIVVKK